MARVPYADDSAHPELAGRIREQRGGTLLNLYRMLLNCPPVAEGWLSLLTAVRQQCALPALYRELVILRVAILNDALDLKANAGGAIKAKIREALETLRPEN